MSLQSIYKRYLASPTADVLAEDANINYIPTLSSISGPAAILKHHKAQDQHLTKKKEDILNVVESENGVCMETETTMQFTMGGGTYLPGIDDNMIADRIVTLPIVSACNPSRFLQVLTL